MERPDPPTPRLPQERAIHQRYHMFRLLLAAGVAVTIAIMAGGAWHAWNAVWRRAENELAAAAFAGAEVAFRMLDGHLLLANRVNDLLEDFGDDEIRAREAELHEQLKQMIASRPEVITLAAIDPAGLPMVGANTYPVDRGSALNDRDYFQAMMRDNAPAKFVGQAAISRVDGQLFDGQCQRITGRQPG